MEQNEYRGMRHDGLSSFVRPLTFGNIFAERLLQQLSVSVHQSQAGSGVTRKGSTKAEYMAWGYLKRCKVTGDKEYAWKAAVCFEWLMNNTAPAYRAIMGNHFDFTSRRAGRLPRFEPIIVWTSLIGLHSLMHTAC